MPNPLDTRPLAERFDLTYVGRRTWPNNVTFWLSLAASAAVVACVAALATMGDRSIYTSGDLTNP